MSLYMFVFGIFSRRRKISLDRLSNEELVSEFNSGRVEAFELVVNRFERPLFFYALRRIQDNEAARDVVQETFLKLTQHAHRYDPNSPLSAWLYTITRNKCIDYLRKRRYREVSMDQSLGSDDEVSLHYFLKDDGPNSSEKAEAREIASRIDEALQEINPDQREIFLLREVHGLKFIEIAELLSVSENTVKSRMRYALEALRKQLDDFVPTLPQNLKP